MSQEPPGSQEVVGGTASPGEPQPRVGVPPGVGMAIALQTGPVPPQILDRISDQHITSMLEYQENHQKRQHDLAMRQLEARERDRQNQRVEDGKHLRNLLFFGVAVLGFMLGLTWMSFAYGQADVAKMLVPAVLTFGAGFAAGMGYQRSRQ